VTNVLEGSYDVKTNLIGRVSWFYLDHKPC
jgi:hypothetical protein